MKSRGYGFGGDMLNKRWVSAGITVLGAIFLLAGCGEKRGQRTNGLDTEEMAGHDGCIVVGYAQVGSESDWRTTNTQSFKNIFTEENGYYLIFEDGQQKQENKLHTIGYVLLWFIVPLTLVVGIDILIIKRRERKSRERQAAQSADNQENDKL